MLLFNTSIISKIKKKKKLRKIENFVSQNRGDFAWKNRDRKIITRHRARFVTDAIKRGRPRFESIVISPVLTFCNYTVTAHAKLSSRRGFIIISPAFLDRIGLESVAENGPDFRRSLDAWQPWLTILSGAVPDARKRS